MLAFLCFKNRGRDQALRDSKNEYKGAEREQNKHNVVYPLVPACVHAM
jgi:hypothetical protein